MYIYNAMHFHVSRTHSNCLLLYANHLCSELLLLRSSHVLQVFSTTYDRYLAQHQDITSYLYRTHKNPLYALWNISLLISLSLWSYFSYISHLNLWSPVCHSLSIYQHLLRLIYCSIDLCNFLVALTWYPKLFLTSCLLPAYCRRFLYASYAASTHVKYLIKSLLIMSF